MSVIVAGDRELLQALSRVERSVRRDTVQGALRKSAAVIEKRVKDKAPVHDGVLRDRIDQRSVSGEPLEREVGTYAPHSSLVEYGGTSEVRGVDSPEWLGGRGMPLRGLGVIRANVGRMPARPFFEPAVHQSRGRALRVLAEEVADVIEAQFGRGRR